MFVVYMAYKVSKAQMEFTYIIFCVEKPTVFPNKTSLFGQNNLFSKTTSQFVT